MSHISNLYSKLSLIIKYGFTPFTIFSPIPIFCIVLFCVAYDFDEIGLYELYIFGIGLIITLISSSAANFWNHTNDLKEDLLNKKGTFLTSGAMLQKEAVIISIILYLASFCFVLYASFLTERPVYLYFIVWVIATWLYSDGIFITKLTKFRPKTHYVGEIATYCIAFPAYTMSIWLIFSDSLKTGIILSMIFLCYGFAEVFIKDLKDIKGDKKAGLKTLGVVFSRKTLIKASCVFLLLYFIIIISESIGGIFDIRTLFIIVPFIYLIINTVNNNSTKVINNSVYLSLVIICITNLLF